MTDPRGALAFLLLRSTRNRIARQLARARRPRHALALLIGVLYFWLVFGPRGDSAREILNGGISPTVTTGLGLGLAITVLRWWIVGGLSSALAFQPAEVQLLFTAPISRRTLLVYRIARTQLVLLASCVIWTLLSGRWGVTLAWPLRFASAWVLFSLLGMHRLAMALLQTEPLGARRRLARDAARLVGVVAGFALAAGLVPPLLRMTDLGWGEGMRALGAAAELPPAVWALAPFRLLMAPWYASSLGAWAASFSVVVGLLALHTVWVLGMRVPFEESAATASAEVARLMAAFKDRRSGGGAMIKQGKVKPTRIPLAPTGAPAVALVWKNTIAGIRVGGLRAWLVMLGVFVAMSVLTVGGGELTLPLAMAALLSFLLGPRALRNDLRMDLRALPSLKTWPLSGATLVAAEVAAPALILTAFQVVLAVMLVVAAPAQARAALPLAPAAALVVIAPIAALALNALSVGIQNAQALLFPSWVKLGPDSGGVEAVGQSLLATIGSVMMLAVALLPPVVAGGVVVLAGADALGPYTPAAACWVLGTVLVFELWVGAALLGRVFDRMDPAALA